MKYRIVERQENFAEQKTMLSVELIQPLGDLSRVTDKIKFSIPGIHQEEKLLLKIGEFLNEHGFNVTTVNENT